MEKNENSKLAKERIKQIDKELSLLRDEALDEYSLIKHSINMDSTGQTVFHLHGTISSIKECIYDINHEEYEEFEGTPLSYKEAFLTRCHDRKYISIKLHIEMLKSAFLKEYILLYLERDFYKKKNSRSREKLNVNLSEIYFGNKNHNGKNNIKSLFIATRKYQRNIERGPRWETHYAQVKNAKYNYYSVKHLLTEGIVVDENRVFFENIQEFYCLDNFIETPVERKFVECYLEYLSKLKNTDDIPLLIPQYRYNREESDHEQRADFMIMNYTCIPSVRTVIFLEHNMVEQGLVKFKINDGLLKKNKINSIEYSYKDLENIELLFERDIIPLLTIK